MYCYYSFLIIVNIKSFEKIDSERSEKIDGVSLTSKIVFQIRRPAPQKLIADYTELHKQYKHICAGIII